MYRRGLPAIDCIRMMMMMMIIIIIIIVMNIIIIVIIIIIIIIIVMTVGIITRRGTPAADAGPRPRARSLCAGAADGQSYSSYSAHRSNSYSMNVNRNDRYSIDIDSNDSYSISSNSSYSINSNSSYSINSNNSYARTADGQSRLQRWLELQQKLLAEERAGSPKKGKAKTRGEADPLACALPAEKELLRAGYEALEMASQGGSKELFLPPRDFLALLSEASLCPAFSVELYRAEGALTKLAFCSEDAFSGL